MITKYTEYTHATESSYLVEVLTLDIDNSFLTYRNPLCRQFGQVPTVNRLVAVDEVQHGFFSAFFSDRESIGDVLK